VTTSGATAHDTSPDAAGVKARVLDFYRTLAFNRHATPRQQIADIREHDPVATYPLLGPLLKRTARVLEVGSGTGWFSNAIAHHHHAQVHGIDLNPDAVAFASDAALRMKLASRFDCADLFGFTPAAPFPLVVSLGVLHHTHDCLAAVRHVCGSMLAPGGHAFIGLYHRHGRAPFLEHFREMQARGASEHAMFARYRQLHANLGDDTHARSWFRDQVLHPHETQHTLAELVAPLAGVGCDIVSTSINRFAPLDDGLDRVLATEPSLRAAASERLRQGVYDPGFFLFLARKRGA
jgi:2-polyprenyl-3-methyl-5-hydroxy-6-metoxy-1,4-benzoquinol methylase